MQAFIEKGCLEELILEQYDDENSFLRILSSNPNWTICTSLTDEELEDEQARPGSLIAELININHGVKPIPLKADFDEIKHTNFAYIVEKPTSLFILDISNEKSQEIKERFGQYVFNLDSFDSRKLANLYQKSFSKWQRIEDEKMKGWQVLLSNYKHPSNSLILVDNFLFANTESVKKGEVQYLGITNTVDFLDCFLPQNLEVNYHLTIITSVSKSGISIEKINKLSKKLEKEVRALRDYTIEFELIKQDHPNYHDRTIISNYLNGETSKGMSFFTCKDRAVIAKEHKKIMLKDVYFGLKESTLKGDLEFELMENYLRMYNEVRGVVYKNRLFKTV